MNTQHSMELREMTPNNSDGRTIACVVDTECCYKNAKPYDEANGLVYHFGAVFGDINQQQYSISYKEMDYYVKEVIENIDNFFFMNREGTPYGTNGAMKRALKDAIRNPHKVKRWKHIMEEFQDEINSRGVEYLTSYNYNFDIGAGEKQGTIRKTNMQLTDKAFYLPRGVDYFCLMDCACNIVANDNFAKWYNALPSDMQKQMQTEKGNKSYSAQTLMRYISQDLYYTEQHTALRDSRMEFRLLNYMWQHSNWKSIMKKEFVNKVMYVSPKDFHNGISSTQKRKNRLERGMKISNGMRKKNGSSKKQEVLNG